jgi:mannitol 2-dehydrogenase
VTALNSHTLAQLGPRVSVPRYDRDSVTVGIVHFGVGGFHRAHEAMYLDTLMNQGVALDWGICGVGLMPGDRRMARVLSRQDGLYTLVTRAPDGTSTARVIGSIVDYQYGPDDPEAVLARLTAPSTRIVSMTVTEAGYNVHRVTGEFDANHPGVLADRRPGAAPSTVFAYVVEALARRRQHGIAPFTVLSCDNVQGNGAVARAAFIGFARLRDPELADWISVSVQFPDSMVDRITPATTSADVQAVHEEYGIEDEWPVVCEPFTQWVLQDRFDAGRPPLEQAGVQVVDDVEPYELMKLRLLNASHQALAYAGYLAGYRYVHEASTDPAFVALLRRYMNEEALPTLRPVPGIDLPRYIEDLIERFGNPEIRDTLARLCVDASERIPKFLLPVIRHQLATGGPVQASATVIASWARYVEGTDENGEPIELVDPARDELAAAARAYPRQPLAFLQLRDIFGDLATQERFTAYYRGALDSLHRHGAQHTIGALAELS